MALVIIFVKPCLRIGRLLVCYNRCNHTFAFLSLYSTITSSLHFWGFYQQLTPHIRAWQLDTCYLNRAQHPASFVRVERNRMLCWFGTWFISFFLLVIEMSCKFSKHAHFRNHLSKPGRSLQLGQFCVGRPWRVGTIQYLTIWDMVPLTSLHPLCQYLSYD